MKRTETVKAGREGGNLQVIITDSSLRFRSIYLLIFSFIYQTSQIFPKGLRAGGTTHIPAANSVWSALQTTCSFQSSCVQVLPIGSGGCGSSHACTMAGGECQLKMFCQDLCSEPQLPRCFAPGTIAYQIIRTQWREERGTSYALKEEQRPCQLGGLPSTLPAMPDD